MFDKILYLYSKLILRLQYPSIRESRIHRTSKVGYRSNVIRLQMDKYSYMGNNNSVMNTNIGKFCSLASYCAIGGGEHPTNWVSTSPCFYGQSSLVKGKFSNKEYNDSKAVNIGNDVWIGEKCFIKSGISIGDGAIIGSHTVVTKDIPPYAIVVGSPAKVIKYRFNDDIIKQLLDIKWWDFDDIKMKKYSNLFDNPEEFIKEYKKNEL